MFDAYRKTFVHGEDNLTVDWHSVVCQIVVPIAVSFALVGLGVRADQSGSLISVVSIVSGWMCATAVFLFELRRSSMRDDKRLTSRDRDAASELFYLAVWLSASGFLLSVFCALVSLVEFSGIGLAEAAISFVAVFGMMHFAAVFISFLERLLGLFHRISEKR